MTSISKTLSHAHADLTAAVRRLHAVAQAGRFARLTVLAFAAQVPTVVASFGSRALAWSAVAAALLGAAETAFRQAFPSFRLDQAASVVVAAITSHAVGVTAAMTHQVPAEPGSEPTPQPEPQNPQIGQTSQSPHT